MEGEEVAVQLMLVCTSVRMCPGTDTATLLCTRFIIGKSIQQQIHPSLEFEARGVVRT